MKNGGLIVVALIVLFVVVAYVMHVKPNEKVVYITRKPPAKKKAKEQVIRGDGPHHYLSSGVGNDLGNGVRSDVGNTISAPYNNRPPGLYDTENPPYVLGGGVVPSETLVYTSEKDKRGPYHVPVVGPNPSRLPGYNVLTDNLPNGVQDFYPRDSSSSSTMFNSLGYRGPYTSPYFGLDFLGSINANAVGFKEVVTPWEKIGLMTTVDENEDGILNLYRRDIAPYRDLYEYSAQDKNGFIIPLSKSITYLENNDIVEHVTGKESKGPWKVSLFYENKYIYV